MSHLGQLRFGALPQLGRAQLSVPEREARLQRARARVVSEELQCSHHPRTLENHARAHRQYTQFLKDYFGSVERGWRESRPDHVCAYLYECLLPNLTGRSGGSVATSTLQGAVSALGRCFDKYGRERDWCSETGRGNPVRSELVRTAVRAYQQRQTSAGCRPRSAVPMLLSSVVTLVHGMDCALAVAVRAGRSEESAMLLRDVTHLLYMWNSGSRGQDAMYADWDDLYLQRAGEAVVSVHVLWQGEIVQAEPVAGTLLVVPSRSKTEHWRRPGTQEILPNERAQLCAVRRLRTLYQWHRARFQQCPCGPVFVSTREPHARLRAEAAGARVNLARYGNDGGETVHSFRRRHVQAAQAAEEPVAVTMRLTGIGSVSKFTKYADRGGRHLR